MARSQKVDENEDGLEAAQRSPRGRPYSDVPVPGGASGGVPYVTPPNPVDEPPATSVLTPDGRFEIPDPNPVELPLGMKQGPSLADFVHRMIRQEFSQAAQDAGADTFEEADDFDVPDDPVDPLTPYEMHFMPPPAPVTPPASSEVEGGAGGGGVAPTQTPPPPATPITTPNEKT